MTVARSLAEDLRRRGDDEVVQLLELRPDLARPVPRSFADLALRANTAASTVTALADLTAGELDVLTAACALASAGRFSVADVCAGLGRPAEDSAVQRAAATLFARALLWGSSDDIRIAAAARDVVGRSPCNLDPRPQPFRAGVHRADLRELLSELDRAPADVAAAVRRIGWGPPHLAPVGEGVESQAVDWLAQRDLLAYDDDGRLLLPRDVALALRGGLLLATPRLDPPRAGPDRGPARADTECGLAADQVLRSLDRLVARVAGQPLTRQAGGSVRARERDAVTAAAGLDGDHAGALIAVAWHLLWLDDDSSGRLRPTTRFDESLAEPRAQRWARAVAGWLDLPYVPSAGAVPRAADPGDVPHLRRMVLQAAGQVPGDDVADWLQWYRPRRPVPPQMLAHTLLEARMWGLVGPSASPPPESLIAVAIAGDPAQLAARIESMLPELTAGFILQADLTATALGPLPPAVERRLLGAADWESGGAGTVFRFSAASLRRALAHGEDPDDLLVWLAAESRTSVPQALRVLVADTSRARSRMSVSAVGSVLRCDDAVAASLRDHPAMADAGIRRLAPGVYSCDLAADELSRRLRAIGHQVDGDAGRAGPIAPTRRSQAPDEGPTATPERIVRSLRRVEERAHPEQNPPDRLAPLAGQRLRSLLESSCTDHRRLWLQFADDSGTATTRLIEPLGLADGEICAFDLTGNEIRMIPIARVTAASVPD